MAESHLAIHAPRLDLILMSRQWTQVMQAADWATASQPLLGAEIPHQWRTRGWHWLDARHALADADPSAIPWLPRVLVLRRPTDVSGAAPVIVGDAGFHGPPDDEGRVEIGYAVLSEHRRHGFAEEAVGAILAWAAREFGVTRFSARIEPRNVPSLNLIRKLGFSQTGVAHEQNNELLVFHRDGPPPP
jgi:[ribosomal protein S5]-alanine N-acetyltransferase